MIDLLINRSNGRKIALVPESSEGKQAKYVLLFDKINKDKANSCGCTAKFMPSIQFQKETYSLLHPTKIYGCIGLVNVDSEPFICLISDCKNVATPEGSEVFVINNVIFYSLESDKYDQITTNGQSYIRKKPIQWNQYDDGLNSYPEDEFEAVRHPCYHIQRFLSSGCFYFSTSFDLTRPAQSRYQNFFNRNILQIEQNSEISLWEECDERFFWNKSMISELLEFRRLLPPQERTLMDKEHLLVMVINGFVEEKLAQMRSESIKMMIISRISCKRTGTRFNMRGIDDDGMVANFVETEQIVYARNHCFSYMILRGSVPLFWEQTGLQLQHKIELSRSYVATQPAVEKHFSDLLSRYGNQHVVNLLSKKEGSSEVMLSNAYSNHIRHINSESIRLTNFDFHAAAKGNNFGNLASILVYLRESMSEFGYLDVDLSSKNILNFQKGTFRVNCLDCLDRTNVIQGLICKNVLHNFSYNTLQISGEAIFSGYLNEMWADNGDQLSLIYTGTGALKSGFTRTGKRTIMGFMDDAKKSATRFYMNNFQDKGKQDVIDQLLGKISHNTVKLHNPIGQSVQKYLDSKADDWSSELNLRVFVGTWNVNGQPPMEESILPWLNSINGPADVYVIGFQEIVELSPQQIMATDMTKLQVWERLILNTLNENFGSNTYIPIKSCQLVGAAVCVFVKQIHIRCITHVQSAIKKTGLAGLSGNKGGVAVSFNFHDSSLCFICAHLAAGQSNWSDRNNDYRTINDGLEFGRRTKIPEHEFVVWLGDFNYRVDMENDLVRKRLDAGDVEHIFKEDQLSKCMAHNLVFQGFHEGKISFLPTYRYDAGTNNYDTSEKNRTPAWCDRILFKGKMKQLSYERAELMSSDHKPVKAEFIIPVKMIDKIKKEKIQNDLFMQYTKYGRPISNLEEGVLIDAPLNPPKLPPRPGSKGNSSAERNNSNDWDWTACGKFFDILICFQLIFLKQILSI